MNDFNKTLFGKELKTVLVACLFLAGLGITWSSLQAQAPLPLAHQEAISPSQLLQPTQPSANSDVPSTRIGQGRTIVAVENLIAKLIPNSLKGRIGVSGPVYRD